MLPSLQDTNGFFIGGTWVAGSGRMKIDLVNPATEEK